MATRFSALALVLCLSPFGCEARSNYVTEISADESTNSCIQSYCDGPLMSHIITESAAGADFATGLPAPDVGESGTVWWNLILDAQQELADRTQALALAAPGASTKTLVLRLNPLMNVSARFSLGIATNFLYYYQSSVTDAGRLRFGMPSLPPGLKIIDLTAYFDNTTFGSAHAGLPATLPIVTLYRQTPSASTATSVGSQADTSASQAAYDAAHTIVLTLNHTVLSGNDYYVDLTGETGANSAASKLSLAGLVFRIGQP